MDRYKNFFNNKVFSTDDFFGNYYYNDSQHLIVVNDISPKKFTKYVGENILVMTFEGPLYDCLNFGISHGVDVEEKLTAIFSKYGCYYELREPWSLALGRL